MALEAYEAGKLEDQLELDITPIPPGMGALFVPALTQAELEPRVIVYSSGARVASGLLGKRIVLPPGRYSVEVGDGPKMARASREAIVEVGLTTPVQPFFSALRVTAVDRGGRPVERSYVVASGDLERVWEPRRTAPKAEYAETSTWILPPGTYSLALGTDPRADDGRFVATLAPGEIQRLRLVVDEGRLLRVELAERELVVEPSIWRGRWVIGGTFGYDRRSQQLASFNGESVQIGAFTNAEVGIDTGPHLALLNLDLDESWIAFEPTSGRGLPLQKLSDELLAEVQYNFRIDRIFGPYVRASGRVAFFDTQYFADRDITLVTTDESGNQSSEMVSAGDEIELFSSIHPLILQEGVGLALTLVDNEVLTLIARGGVAARQTYFDGGRLITDASSTQVSLLRLSDDSSVGAEATATFGLRLGHVLSLGSQFESFLPQQQVFDGVPVRPVFRLDNTVTLRLGRFASLVYDLDIRRDDAQIEELQIRHNLTLRFQHTVL